MDLLELGCRAALLVVFALAIAGKMRGRASWEAFVQTVGAFGLPSSWPRAPAAAAIVGMEAAATACLIAAPSLGYALSLGLLAIFTAVLGLALRRGQRTPCRCFGASERPIGPAHVARNVALLAVAAAGLVTRLTGSPGAAGARETIATLLVGGGVTTALLAGVAALNMVLSLALVRRIRPLQILIEERGIPDGMLPRIGASVARFRVELADGSVVTDEAVRTGTTLIGFFLPHCPSCDRMYARMREEPLPWPLLAFVEGAAEDPDARAVLEKFAAVGRTGIANDEVQRAVGLGENAAFPTLVRIENGIVTAAGRRLHLVTDY